MDVKAVMSGGRQIGYILDDIFIPRNYFKLCVAGSYTMSDIVFGDQATSDIVLNSGEIVKSIFPDGYKDISSDYLQDFIFVPSKTGSYEYDIVTRCKEKVGYLALQTDLYGGGSTLNILMIEIRDRGKGTGSAVVEHLRGLGFDLVGLSIDSARDFWTKCGVEFKRNGRFYISRL